MKPKGQRERTGTPGSADAGGSYIVRLYRRREDKLYRRREDKSEVVGVVESVEDGTRRAFVNGDDLWAILMGAGGGTAGDAKPDQTIDK